MTETNDAQMDTMWWQPTLEGRSPTIVTVQANVTLYVPQKMVRDVFIVRDPLGNCELLRTGGQQMPAARWLAIAPKRLDRIVAALAEMTGIHEPF